MAQAVGAAEAVRPALRGCSLLQEALMGVAAQQLGPGSAVGGWAWGRTSQQLCHR